MQFPLDDSTRLHGWFDTPEISTMYPIPQNIQSAPADVVVVSIAPQFGHLVLILFSTLLKKTPGAVTMKVEQDYDHNRRQPQDD